eukprot:gene2827-7278_t
MGPRSTPYHPIAKLPALPPSPPLRRLRGATLARQGAPLRGARGGRAPRMTQRGHCPAICGVVPQRER